MTIRSAQHLIGVILVLEKRADGLAPFLGLLEQEQVSAVDDAQLRTGNAAGGEHERERPSARTVMFRMTHVVPGSVKYGI
jgi:hypothetical protein